MSKKFVLDANTFIEAKNRYYGLDFCPGFWTSLIGFNGRNVLFSIDRIRDELVPKKKEDRDELAEWISERVPAEFFKQTKDQAVIDKFQEMVKWAYSEPQYAAPARAEFASVADGWLVAFAAVNNCVVVTHEDFRPEAQTKVPIPNVCAEFDVEYVNTFEMLRTLKAKLIQSTKRRRRRK